MEAEGDPNSISRSRYTPLQNVAQYSDRDSSIIEILLIAWADINAQTALGAALDRALGIGQMKPYCARCRSRCRFSPRLQSRNDTVEAKVWLLRLSGFSMLGRKAACKRIIGKVVVMPFHMNLARVAWRTNLITF